MYFLIQLYAKVKEPIKEECLHGCISIWLIQDAHQGDSMQKKN